MSTGDSWHVRFSLLSMFEADAGNRLMLGSLNLELVTWCSLLNLLWALLLCVAVCAADDHKGLRR